MNDNKKGITVAGSLIADVYYQIDTYPNQGFLTNVRGSRMHIGGSGNLILDLAKLNKDLTVKVCAVTGKDERGPGLVSLLSKYPNIDTENITLDGESAACLVMNAEDTKQRTFFYIPASSDIFSDSYINWDNINTKIFHLEYLLLMKTVDSPDAEYGTHGARILKKAKDRGMITSIDMVSEQSDRAKTIIRSALKYTDICCINEVEAETVTEINLLENGELNEASVMQAIKEMQKMGVSKWIVIHAPKFGYGYDCETERLYFVPSLNLPKGYIKGTTGAGDAYCSGVLYGAHEDMNLEEAMKLARACAACSLSEENGTDGMREFNEVLLLAEKYN